MNDNLVSQKIRLIYMIMFVMAGLIIIFCIRWQVVDASKFSREALGRNQNTLIPSLRGTIYAADGSTLAYSEPRYNVYVYEPELRFAESKGLQTREEFLTKVASVIDTTPEELGRLIDSNVAKGVLWFEVAKAISVEDGQTLSMLTRDRDAHLEEGKRGRIIGQFLQYTAKRVYPEERLASQVLGLTDIKTDDREIKTTGRGGVEGEWDGFLEPISGFVSGETDAKGNAVGLASVKTIEAKRGSSVYTSIDKRLQKAVEDKLEWGVQTFGARSGSIVVIEPTTGRILSIANYPTYNANLRESTNPEIYGNKAVAEPYEIGSVGKIFTLATAVDVGRADAETVVINGHAGCEKIHDDLLPVCTHDKRPQPAMALKDAFRISDNLYFFHLAQRIERSDFYDHLSKFGIGRPTGVDLAGESFGYLKNHESWNIADVAAYSYGHSYQITALQATVATAALANYGVRMQPQIVTKVVEADGTEKNYQPIPLERVVSRDTVLQMDEMMHQVYLRSINNWEHHLLDLRNYKIAMKSGTALIPFRDRAGYSSEFNATYVGYDASPDRKFVMLVRLEAPTVGNLSSSNARVLWLETFKDIKDILGVRRKSQF